MERNSVLDTSEAQHGFLPRFMQRIPKLGSILKISQPIVTALLSSNPYTAAAITTTYIVTGEILNHIERRNLEVWLKAYVDRNIEELIDPDAPNIQEFVQHSVLKAVRCSKEAQVNRIMDVFQAALKDEISSYEEAEDFMNVISELSENEAILLVQIYKYFEANPDVDGFNEYRQEIFFKIPRYAWDYLLNRLEGKGLLNSEPTVASENDIDALFDGLDGETSDDSSENREEYHLIINSKTYSTTEFGKRLFQSIN